MVKINQALCSKAWGKEHAISPARFRQCNGHVFSRVGFLLGLLPPCPPSAWPLAPPPSLRRRCFQTAKKPQTFPRGLLFSRKLLGVVSRSLRISPVTLAHVPSTSLCRSHILSWPPVNRLSSLFFPLHLLVFIHMRCSNHRHIKIATFLPLHVPGNESLPISTAKALNI